MVINLISFLIFQSVLSAPHIKQKPKILRKAIQASFKKYGLLTDRECCFKFLEILKSVYRFDQERFRCALGVRTLIFNKFIILLNFEYSVTCIDYMYIFILELLRK